MIFPLGTASHILVTLELRVQEVVSLALLRDFQMAWKPQATEGVFCTQCFKFITLWRFCCSVRRLRSPIKKSSPFCLTASGSFPSPSLPVVLSRPN